MRATIKIIVKTMLKIRPIVQSFLALFASASSCESPAASAEAITFLDFAIPIIEQINAASGKKMERIMEVMPIPFGAPELFFSVSTAPCCGAGLYCCCGCACDC